MRQIVFILCFALFSFSSQARQYIYPENIYFFKTSWGVELAVSVSWNSSSRKLDYTIFNKRGIDTDIALREFASAALAKRIYRYYETTPCGYDCHTHYNIDDQLADGRRGNSNTHRESNPGWLDNFFNAFASGAGTATATQLVNNIERNSGAENQSQFRIITSSSGYGSKATGICKITATTCDPIDAEVKHLGNKLTFKFNYKTSGGGTPSSETLAVTNLIDDYSASIEYACITTFTGSNGRMVAQTTCFRSN
ncbi:hypothetical protein [Pseudoalteromonas luteoviolacea]|uniref:Uncharacterized protein n=1 Tax=Pseudoalteromonas luteoviolacea S4060-1 TaxID=1365257 RepID=A0A161YHU4_9GAMM|nr:hypothetical protein [Pseudoalteromonas luteoviolacea]KZN60454.1 hypothetical protein N478_07795 [Pseudoalteromonas luteoviolacea S4060-1]